MQVISAQSAPEKTSGNLREGNLSVRVMLMGKEGSLNNYRASMETAEESWSTPKHRHNFDQIRLPIAGTVDYGKTVDCPVGTVAYFPESIYYGPQVRHHASKVLTIQVGGAAGNGYMSQAERKRAFEELKKKGTFEKGIFSYYDDTGKVHRQDAYEACWEHIRGRKLKYAPPRYTNHVVMNPDHFAWIPDANQHEVSHKWLGTFTERQTTVSYIRVDRSAQFSLAADRRPQMLFIVKGAVSHGGQDYGDQTAFGLDAGESLNGMTGLESPELLHVQMPYFSEAEMKNGRIALES